MVAERAGILLAARYAFCHSQRAVTSHSDQFHEFADVDLGDTVRGFSAGRTLFGRFTLVRILGRGGMGVVWLARDEQLECEVALKFLPEIVAHDRQAIAELKREVLKSRTLNHHHIVRVHDFVTDGQTAAISMEPIDGGTLTDLRLDRPNEVFEVEDLRAWVEQLCAALSYAHGTARMVHRDLKPKNLMVTAKGELKVADFGISRSITDSTSMVSMAAVNSGSPPYMSPQQVAGENPSAADDIYAVGATLLELLTGRPPFYRGGALAILDQIKTKTPERVNERRRNAGLPGEVPLPWEETIAACLAKDPAERPVSAAQVWARLNGQWPGTAAQAVESSEARSGARVVAVSTSDTPPPDVEPEYPHVPVADRKPAAVKEEVPFVSPPPAPEARNGTKRWPLVVFLLCGLGIIGAIVLKSVHEIQSTARQVGDDAIGSAMHMAGSGSEQSADAGPGPDEAKYPASAEEELAAAQSDVQQRAREAWKAASGEEDVVRVGPNRDFANLQQAVWAGRSRGNKLLPILLPAGEFREEGGLIKIQGYPYVIVGEGKDTIINGDVSISGNCRLAGVRINGALSVDGDFSAVVEACTVRDGIHIRGGGLFDPGVNHGDMKRGTTKIVHCLAATTDAYPLEVSECLVMLDSNYFLGGAGGQLRESSGVNSSVIEGNVFADSKSDGLAIHGIGAPTLRNNRFCRNAGWGLESDLERARIAPDNVFFKNRAGNIGKSR